MWIHHVDPLFMFSTPTFFLILVTLPTITEQVPASERKPDWNECTVQTRCFCFSTVSQMLVKQTAAVIPQEFECEKAGAQNRFFTVESALIQFHIAGEAPGNKLTLIKEETITSIITEKFGCKFDNSGKATLTGDNKLLKKHRMVLFEDRSRSTQGYSLCAIKVERIGQLYSDMHLNLDKLTLALSIEGAAAITYLFQTTGAPAELLEITNTGALKCDPFSFEDKPALTDYQVRPVMNRDVDHLDCTSYEDDTYTMKYDFGDKMIADLTGLTCTPDASVPPTWHYELDGQKDENGDPVRIAPGEKYTIYCAAPIGKACQDPFRTDCPQGPECPKIIPGLPNEPLKLKCPDMKWRINDEYLVLAKDPECKSDPMGGDNAAAFFITQDSGTDRRVDGARCFTDYDCEKTAPIFLDDSMEYSNGEVKCKDKNIVMEIHFYEKNETLPATSFACDKADGQWKNKTSSGELGELIPAGSQLRCPVVDNGAEAQIGEVALSEGAIIGIIIGSSIGFLILVALILFGVLYYKKKRRVKTIDKDALRKMDQAERIKHCREFFPMVLNTTPTTVHHVIDGLVEIDVLLEMGIEDPDVWDAVYPFIMRIHGAIFKMDRGVGLMFNRYLYLQAKAIIDKHGWTCKTPIRKSNTDGLIRCVAINLLSFAISDGVGSEAKKLMLKGFRELRFRGKKQYPHCGLMWSLVSHARIRRERIDPDLTKQCKDDLLKSPKAANSVRKFNEKLKSLASKTTDIPPGEIIPNFGTVVEQAYIAHGGWQSVGYHQNNFGAVIKGLAGSDHGKKIALAYMDGLARSLTRCPAQSIFLATGQAPPTPSAFAYGVLCKTATAEEWAQHVEKAFPVCVYYGRHMDANKLEEAFITRSSEPSPKLKQMRLEQKDFIAAMDKQMEEMREWYAEHTDKDEFKKKPVYVISEKFKQYYRKYEAQPTTTPLLENAPKPASEKSNSGGAPTGKSQTDVKSSEGSSDSKNTPEKPAPEAPAPAPAPGPPST